MIKLALVLAVVACNSTDELDKKVGKLEEDVATLRKERQFLEVKHVQLFRRYADALKAQRPALAAELDGHLQRSFATAWWHDDAQENYPSAAVYHFVNWLHFVYFEEYFELSGNWPEWLHLYARTDDERP